MIFKIILGFCLGLSCLSAFAQDFGGKEPKGEYTKFVHEMKPYELESTLTGYPRCRLSSSSSAFPYDVDFVIANGVDGKLYFLELTSAATKKIKILYLEEVGSVGGGYTVAADQRTLGVGWIAKATITPIKGKGVDVLLTELSSSWQIGSALNNVLGSCH